MTHWSESQQIESYLLSTLVFFSRGETGEDLEYSILPCYVILFNISTMMERDVEQFLPKLRHFNTMCPRSRLKEEYSPLQSSSYSRFIVVIESIQTPEYYDNVTHGHSLIHRTAFTSRMFRIRQEAQSGRFRSDQPKHQTP